MNNNIVYDRLVVPVGLHYYGITVNLESRKQYKTTSLQAYIDEYGWDNINTIIVAEGLTRKEAELLEDRLIKEGWGRGDCINKVNSGGYERDDKKEYNKQYRENHREHRIEYNREWRKNNPDKVKEQQKRSEYNRKDKKREYNRKRRQTPAGKIYNRVNNYNRHHPDRILITPMEAKDMYELTGYIPNFIKNNDL